MQFIILEEKILKRLINSNLDNKDQARLRYGFYLVLDFLKKAVIVYLIAVFLGTLLETLLVHMGFMYFRQVTYGWHFSSNKRCYIGSVAIFSLLPYALSLITISSPLIYIYAFNCIIILYLLGPIETRTSKIPYQKRLNLRLKLKNRLIITAALVLIIPNHYYFFLLTGLYIQVLTLFIQILKNRRRENVGEIN